MGRFFTGQNVETTMLITSLRDVIRTQAEEMEDLRRKVQQLTPYADEVSLFKIAHTPDFSWDFRSWA